jgi:hypothetical protein
MNTLFIMVMKFDRAFVSPKDITVYSYRPYLVGKAVLGISCSRIFSLKYPDQRSILENNFAPFNWSNK